MSAPRDARFLAVEKAPGVRPEVVAAIEREVREGDDASLCRIDPLDFAERHGVSEDDAITAFVHAAKQGLFEMAWSLVCPGCGGILEDGKDLRAVRKPHYACSLCVEDYEPSLDEMVEVSFTVSPSLRKIAAHDPHSLPFWEYYRQVYHGAGLRMPSKGEWEEMARRMSIEAEEVPPRGKAVLSFQAPAKWLIVFDPVTHGATMIDVKGEPTRDRQETPVVFTEEGASPDAYERRPGPIRLTLENRTSKRVLATVWMADDTLHQWLGSRRGYLTAKRVLTNQAFRDLYRTDVLEIDQRLRIADLTVLFTDLKGSTGLYDRVGDLAAYDLVRHHFDVLGDVVRSCSGAVVKTIGDAVMATFSTPREGVDAALRMRAAMDSFNRKGGHEDLLVKIGLHAGPCLAVVSNERLDYFGQTVNVASRVQGLASSREIVTTERVVADPGVSGLLAEQGLSPQPRRAALRGLTDEYTVFEIP
jgi:class 3 adenylate cyclase